MTPIYNHINSNDPNHYHYICWNCEEYEYLRRDIEYRITIGVKQYIYLTVGDYADIIRLMNNDIETIRNQDYQNSNNFFEELQLKILDIKRHNEY